MAAREGGVSAGCPCAGAATRGFGVCASSVTVAPVVEEALSDDEEAEAISATNPKSPSTPEPSDDMASTGGRVRKGTPLPHTTNLV